jgi:hypothetical protein
VNVSIPAAFSPFGNQTDANRFGDDLSSMLVDVNGVLLWRNSDGEVLVVPNSEQAAPLIVSDTESIVWRNAFVDYTNYTTKPAVEVAIYRVDPATGLIGAPTPVPLLGKEIVSTSQVTTTSNSYVIVTSEHELTLDAVGTNNDTLFRVYRVTFSGQVQRLSQFQVYQTGPGDVAATLTKSLGHGSDGSIVIFQNGVINWVDGSRINNVAVELTTGAPDETRVVFTSKSRVIFEKFDTQGDPFLVERRRNSDGLITADEVEIQPGLGNEYTRLFEMSSTLTVNGENRYFYALSENEESILVFTVTNTGIRLVYEAILPSGVSVDSLSFVEKINPEDGSAIIATDNANLLWLHNSSSADQEVNITEILDSSEAQSMFVTGTELVIWRDAKQAVPRGGKLDRVNVFHYELGLDGQLFASTNLSPSINGNYVLASPPFTPPLTEDFDYWLFSTVEKTSQLNAVIRTYRLASGLQTDSDSDRLPDGLEEIVGMDQDDPNWTSVSDPDTDGDGLTDGEEVQPYWVINGSFTFEEARLDAIRRGGRLAVPDTRAKSEALKRQLRGGDLGRLWIGGGDLEGKNDKPNQREGEYRWVDKFGRFFTSSGKSVGVPFGKFSNWNVGQPSNIANTDGVQIERDFSWSSERVTNVQSYVLELPATKPNLADTDGDGLSDQQELGFVNSPRKLTDLPGELIPSNPTKVDTDGDGLTDKEELDFGSSPSLVDTDGDGLTDDKEFSFGTNPNLADTDGDGLTDRQEFGFGTDPLLADTDGDSLSDSEEGTLGTDPLKKDTDEDGVSDSLEVNTYKTNPLKKDTDGDGLSDRVELFKSKTDPLEADSDGDGLSDGQEVNGVKGFTSNPKAIDTDGDLFNDFDEINAKPPTDPRDPRSFPSGPGSGGIFPGKLHLSPVSYVADQTVQIDESFTPFGQRPDIMKTCEDGATLIRDRNGVLIWTDSTGIPIRLPNSSIALPMFVTSTECAVWNNRYFDYDNYAQKPEAEVILYRRDGTGVITSATTVPLQGKSIIDTAPVTATTNSFIICTIERFDNGSESVAIPFVGNPQDVDVWDGLRMRIYRLAWDGVVQRVGTFTANIPKDGDDPNYDMLGYGSDGSFLFNLRIGVDFLGGAGDANPGYWSDVKTYWVTGDASLRQVPDARPPEIDAVTGATLWGGLDSTQSADHILSAYTANGRVVLGDYTQAAINDYRLRADGIAYRSNTIPVNGTVLPFNLYTVVGLPAYVYTADANQFQMSQMEGTLTDIGPPVTLPVDIGAAPTYVRNPRDGSLLVRTESQSVGMIWFPTIQEALTKRITGLARPVPIPNSTQGLPLHVSRVEAVAWLNGIAPVLAGGFIPPAEISHYYLGKNRKLATTNLTPPIQGNFVLNTPLVSSDPDGEGWFITTFEKSSPRTALVRTYLLDLPRSADRDTDGVSDYDELTFGTDIGNPDSDNDGLPDGQELRPFQVVRGEFTWEEARRDSILKGGRLAVLSSSARIKNAQLAVGSLIGSSTYWVGAHDLLTETKIQWLSDSGLLGGPKVTKPSNWAPFQPDNQNNADSMQVGPASNMKWSMAQSSKIQSYIIEFSPTNPLVSDTDGDGLPDGTERGFTTDPTKTDTDGDGLDDRQERQLGTNPLKKDTDGDGLSDGEEFNRYDTDPLLADTDKDGLDDGDEVAEGTNPLKRDSDGDGLNDGAEIEAGSNPLKPDTDGDGLNDGREVELGTNPTKKDTDGDGISDFDEVRKGSDPLDKNDPKGLDSDNDGLSDYEELFVYNTNPDKADTDGDGLDDKLEIDLGTNPNSKDSDGDGVSDFDEVYVTNTDPTDPSFDNSGGGVTIPFGSAAVYGDYEGVVFGATDGLAFKQKLRLSKNGTFSSSLQGLRRNTSFRGKFSDKGTFATGINLTAGIKSVRMNVVEVSKGMYYIRGTFATRSGGVLYFELRPVTFTKAKAYGQPGKVTFQAATTGNAPGPSGAGVATGEFRRDGMVSFRVYLPDGSRGSFSAPMVDGNMFSMFTKGSTGSRPVMLGSVKIRNVKNSSDFDGSVRYFSASGIRGSLYPSGFDQTRDLLGSRFFPSAVGTLPLKNFRVKDNNSIFRWLKGDFDGVSKVGTWTTDNSMVIAPTQNDKASPTYDYRTGLLTMRYTLTDADRDMTNSVANAHAVVLQKSGLFKGYYTSDRAAAAFSVIPNTSNVAPDVTSVSPLGKFVPAAETTYTVSVGTKGAWDVVIPDDVPWVTATVTSAGGATGPSTTTGGSGNGTVTITVALNVTNTRREGSIKIAGLTHTVTQEFR